MCQRWHLIFKEEAFMDITNNSNNMSVIKELGHRIQDIRIARNLTRFEFSEICGVPVRTLARIEAGENVNFTVLCDILRAFGYLNNLNLILPEQSLMPTQIADGQTQKKKRVYKKRIEKETKNFIWGEDK